MDNPISEAIKILTADADSLRESHTPPCDRNDWSSDPETKAYYDRLVSVAGALSRLRAPVAQAEVMDALNWVDDFIARCNRDDRGSCESVNVLRRALASAPVAGEAQPVIHQHGFASDNQKLRAINESLDEQLEEVMAERDDYHDWADELSEAIAAHLGVEIGEHSSSNLPWLRALDAIKNAAPQASEAVRMEDLKAIAREVAADSAAIRAEARNAALEEAAKLMDQTSRSSGAALIRAQASAPVAGEAQQPVAVVRDNPEDYGTVIDALVALPVGTQLFAAPQPSSVAGEAQERIEQMAVNRYRPVPDGKFSYKVVAGDGSRSLYTGTKDSCLRVAAKLTEAFLDGAFVASYAALNVERAGQPYQPSNGTEGEFFFDA